MPFQSVPECAETVIRGEVDSQNVFNVLNWWHPGGYTQSDIDNLGAAIDTNWAAQMLPHAHTSYAYRAVDTRGLTSPVDLVNTSSLSAGPGVIGGDSFPTNVAFVLTFYTGHSGRSARGRIYLGFIPASKTVTQNRLDVVYANQLQAAMYAVAAGGLLVGWHLSIVSRISLGLVRPLGTHLDVLTIVPRNTVLDSQRGRLPSGH